MPCAHAARALDPPDDEVGVRVVDQRRYAPVRIVRGVRGALLLVSVEVEVDGLVFETELAEHEGDFPAGDVAVSVQSDIG